MFYPITFLSLGLAGVHSVARCFSDNVPVSPEVVMWVMLAISIVQEAVFVHAVIVQLTTFLGIRAFVIVKPAEKRQ